MIAWLIDPVNSSLVSSFATITVAILASLTAIYVGVFSYPRQKKFDREQDLHSERREIYRRFAKNCRDIINALTFKAELTVIGEIYRETESIYAELLVSAPDDAVFAAAGLRASITQTLNIADDNKSSEEFQIALRASETSFFKCITEFRMDSFEKTTITSDLFSSKVADRIEELRAAK